MFLRLSGAFVPDRRIFLNILCSRMLWGLTNLVFEFILFLNNYHNSKESWQEMQKSNTVLILRGFVVLGVI